MKDEASKVSPSVLLSIDDSDPIVCPALWEAVLYTLTTIEVSKRGTFSISGNTCLLNYIFFSYSYLAALGLGCSMQDL